MVYRRKKASSSKKAAVAAATAIDTQEDKHEVCLLFESYDLIIEDLLFILHKTYKLEVWPESLNLRFFTQRFSNLSVKFRDFKNDYDAKVKPKIKDAKIVIVVISQKLVECDESLDLIKYAKRLKKRIIGVSVDELHALTKTKAAILKGFDFDCDLSADRVNPTGFDQYLWIGEAFGKLVKQIGSEVNKKFMKPRNTNKAYYNFSIANQEDYKSITRLMAMINASLGYGHQISFFSFHRPFATDSEEYYIDLANEKEKLGGQCTPHNCPVSDYCEAKLEYLNIVNKTEYTSLIKLFDDLLESKMNELKRDGVDAASVKRTEKAQEWEKLVYVNCHILETSRSKSIDPTRAHVLTDMVNKELGKLDISLATIERTFSCLLKNNSENTYESLVRSKLIVIFLTKEYFESSKFEILFKKFLGQKKMIYILKMGEFEFKVPPKQSKKINVYDVYRHKDDNYEGYVTRKFLDDLMEFFKSQVEARALKFAVRSDLFLCNLDDHFSEHVEDLSESLKEKGFNLRSLSLTKDFDKSVLFDEFNDSIEKSRIILIVVTNSVYKSKEFKKLLEAANKPEKSLMFLLAEEIHLKSNEKQLVDFKKFNCIEIYKNFNKNGESIWHGEQFYRLCYLAFSTVGRQDLITMNNGEVFIEAKAQESKAACKFNDNLTRYRKPIQELKIVKSLVERNKRIACFYHHEEAKQLLILIGERMLFYNSDSFEFLEQKRLSDYMSPEYRKLFYNKETQNFYLLNQYYLLVFNSTFELIRRDSFQGICPEGATFYNMAFDQSSQIIYFYNLLTQQIVSVTMNLRVNHRVEVNCPRGSIKDMVFINDHLYTVREKSVVVYDAELKYVTTFGSPLLNQATCLVYDKNTSNCMYILDLQDRCFKVFNFAYKFVGHFEIDSKLRWTDTCRGGIFNQNLILHDDNRMLIHEIAYSINDSKSFRPDSVSDGFFICKINPFNYHVCRNPYTLPCSNVACLECIYDNYNLLTNKFICTFDGCKAEHRLNNEIQAVEIGNGTLETICANQIEYAKRLPAINVYLEEKLECFENWFKFIEEDIEIRYESLNIQVDVLHEEALQHVNETEARLKIVVESTGEPVAKRAKLSSQKSQKGHKKPALHINPIRNFPFMSLHEIDNSMLGHIKKPSEKLEATDDESVESSDFSDSDNDSYLTYDGYDGFDDDDDDYFHDHYDMCTVA